MRGGNHELSIWTGTGQLREIKTALFGAAVVICVDRLIDLECNLIEAGYPSSTSLGSAFAGQSYFLLQFLVDQPFRDSVDHVCSSK